MAGLTDLPEKRAVCCAIVRYWGEWIMGRSLCVAASHIATVKQALKNSQYGSQQALATKCGFGRDTAWKFFNGKPIDRNNFTEFCHLLNLDEQEIVGEGGGDGEVDPDFVGRKEAMDYLDQLRQAGKTCVLMQGAGGVGKTLLAERYLAGRFPGRLVRFDVAKERQAVGSAGGLLEAKLKDLGEESRGEFGVLCDRLRSKLQTEAYGVLVDNLEPALDGKGQLIPEHRDYVELLRVLSDTSLKSFTLITSRERVSENLNIELYRLECLDVDAWRDYFDQQNLNVDSPVLVEMHDAYRGNALAMKVLRARIAEDYQGNFKKYWDDRQTSDGLTVEQEMENLIAQQFERLKKVNLNAYNLLCRMGCFRYQDVPTVPREGLFCLLWEVPQNQAQKAINTLCDLALVDRKNSEYRLHPLIREQAVERLRNSEDWKESNQKSAEFWKNTVESIQNTQDASKALEASFHYLNNDDYQKAAEVICQRRPYIYSQLIQGVSLGATLGGSFIQLGISQKVYGLINNVLFKIPRDYFASKLYNLLGDIHWIKGDVKLAIEHHLESGDIANNLLNLDSDNQSDNYNLIEAKVLDVLCLFNIGICKIDIGEFEEGLIYLKKVLLKTQDSELLSSYSMMALCSVASLLAFLGNTQDALKTVLIVESQIDSIKLGVRSTVYRLYHLARSFQYLGDTRKSSVYYQKALSHSQKIRFRQGQAIATMGIGAIYRIQAKYSESLDHHQQSISILKDIDAKCDLAEAYYQRALTYQKMGDDRAQADFDEALRLWGPDQIDAPKQIERVHNAMNNPPQ